MKSSENYLQKQMSRLELENQDLKCHLEEIMHDIEVVSFDNGKYTSDKITVSSALEQANKINQ